jgi:hypothetical protein
MICETSLITKSYKEFILIPGDGQERGNVLKLYLLK